MQTGHAGTSIDWGREGGWHWFTRGMKSRALQKAWSGGDGNERGGTTKHTLRKRGQVLCVWTIGGAGKIIIDHTLGWAGGAIHPPLIRFIEKSRAPSAGSKYLLNTYSRRDRTRRVGTGGGRRREKKSQQKGGKRGKTRWGSSG